MSSQRHTEVWPEFNGDCLIQYQFPDECMTHNDFIATGGVALLIRWEFAILQNLVCLRCSPSISGSRFHCKPMHSPPVGSGRCLHRGDVAFHIQRLPEVGVRYLALGRLEVAHLQVGYYSARTTIASCDAKHWVIHWSIIFKSLDEFMVHDNIK